MKHWVFHVLGAHLLSLLLQVESKYDVTIERVENALGKEDKFVQFGTLRTKKFNRTT